MKSLKVIQTISKIAKIVSKIIFICSLVGGIACFIGLCTAWIPGVLKFDGVTIENIIDDYSGFSLGNCYAALFSGICFCVAEAVLAKMAENFFKLELEKGTPFDSEVSKKLLSLGITTIWVPIAASAVAAIVSAIISKALSTSGLADFEGFSQVGLGLMFIMTSILCNAAIESKNKAEPETTPEAEE